MQSAMAGAVGESDDQARASLAKVSAFSASNLLVFWFALTNIVAFLLFAWDKFSWGGPGQNL